MILEFRFKPDYWERAGISGLNYFIKDPKDGLYKNFGVGKLATFKDEKGHTLDTEDLGYHARRKHIHIALEFEDDKSE